MHRFRHRGLGMGRRCGAAWRGVGELWPGRVGPQRHPTGGRNRVSGWNARDEAEAKKPGFWDERRGMPWRPYADLSG